MIHAVNKEGLPHRSAIQNKKQKCPTEVGHQHTKEKYLTGKIRHLS